MCLGGAKPVVVTIEEQSVPRPSVREESSTRLLNRIHHFQCSCGRSTTNDTSI
ncbi:unnamed protein product [Acanthoscelides obtectus]|uniref:Uncharacterized protein n=1 Tax=Acanthoscelides obtectus TaxID=200917 RepID=A0A9P0LFM0_ACAOB|nr:unnamed protein product [Acanthoscelides obtectus]CAK1620088.1 hypothetical protein AOBTE_LOCUS190 [Acanthoscelides obtectus]